MIRKTISYNCYYEKIKNLIIPISTVNKEVKTKDVLITGLYPVISQSKNKYDGFSNDKDKLISTTPIVLFGDHTKVVKYIETPFIPGADGTKLLYSKCYPKYLFYLVMYATYKIDNRGYGRHYSYLKECDVPYYANISKQIDLSLFLDNFYTKIEVINQNFEQIDDILYQIKRKYINSIFNKNSSYNSYYGNRQKTTLKDLIPFGKIGDGDWILSEDMDENGEFSLIQLKHIGFGKYINDKSYKHINKAIFKNKKCKEIKENYLLINRLVSSCMGVCIVPELKCRSITSVDVCWISPDERYNQKYLMYYLMSSAFQDKVLLKSSGSTRKRISKNNLIDIELFIHDLEKQENIVNKIERIFSILDSIL